MAGKISRSDIDEVRSRTNLVDVVGQYVTLKPAGVGSWKGLCPFHDERTPSFHVRPQLGYYHCFGCGEGGDAYTFLQKMQQCSFTEAVEQLASKLGYELHYEDGGAGRQERSQRVRILDANDAALAFFMRQLGSREASAARTLLLDRHFGQDAASHFHLGYGPVGWQGLTDAMHHEGFTDEELLAAGLVSRGSRGVYDRFRGRLIWPIRDVTGRTIGFGARKLGTDDQGPKYLNTPETSVYHKANVLYGLDLAKRDIAKQRRVVIVEGYTDVMACHLAGVTTAVATCGTAFGEGHVDVIRRILGDDASRPAEVIFTFDPDAAGQKAALRAFAQERKFVAQTYVAVAPDGLDPSDLRQMRGDAAIQSMIDSKTPMFEFVMRQLVSRFDLNSVEGRAQALSNAAPLVAEMRNRALTDGYTRTLAGLVGVDVQVARVAVIDARRGAGRAAEAPLLMRAGAEPAATPVAPEGPSLARSVGTDANSKLEQQVIEALLQAHEQADAGLVAQALQIPLRNTALDRVRIALVSVDADQWTLSGLLDGLGPAFGQFLQELGVAPMPVAKASDIAPYVDGLLTKLIASSLEQRHRELIRKLQQTSGSAQPAEYAAIQHELIETEQRRRSLQEQ